MNKKVSVPRAGGGGTILLFPCGWGVFPEGSITVHRLQRNERREGAEEIKRQDGYKKSSGEEGREGHKTGER